MRTWIIVLVLVLLIGGAWWWLTANRAGLPVEAAAVQRAAIREFIDERAKTRLPRTYGIAMPYDARILPIDLNEGTEVYENQVVAQVVPKDLELQVAVAQSAVERIERSIEENNDASVEQTGLKQSLNFVESMASTVEAARERVQSGKAKLEFAESTLRRLKRAGIAVTENELEQAQLAEVQARVDYRQDQLVLSAMEAMQAATALMPTAVRQYIDRKTLSGNVLEKQKAEAVARLEQAQIDAARGSIVSPVNGVVLERLVSDEGQKPAGTVLLRIGQLEQLEVEADVLSQDVVNVKVGDMAEIYGPTIGAQPARARVSRVYPEGFMKVSSLGVEQQRVKVVLAFEPDDLQRLREQRQVGVEYRVRVRIFTAESGSALVVPRSALFRGAAGEWQVFAVQDGRVELRDVRVGLMNDEAVEIAEGLQEGDVVVLAPESTLAPGVRVEPVLRKMPALEPPSND